jgi:hypothetical protein
LAHRNGKPAALGTVWIGAFNDPRRAGARCEDQVMVSARVGNVRYNDPLLIEPIKLV